MVTIEELNVNPLVVGRILEEVEKQRGERFKDLSFLNKILHYKRSPLGFYFALAREGNDVWMEIVFNSDFKPFNKFHGINEVVQPRVFHGIHIDKNGNTTYNQDPLWHDRNPIPGVNAYTVGPFSGRLYKDENGNYIREQLSEPQRMWVDEDGNWCIADPKHHTIIKRKVTLGANDYTAVPIIRTAIGKNIKMGPVIGNFNQAEIKVEIEMEEKKYTIQEVIKLGLGINTKTLSENKRVFRALHNEGFFSWMGVEDITTSEEEYQQECTGQLLIPEGKGLAVNKAHHPDKSLKIIDSTQVITEEKETTDQQTPNVVSEGITPHKCVKYAGEVSVEPKTQIDPSDLIEGDKVWSWTGDGCKEPFKVEMDKDGHKYLSTPRNFCKIGIFSDSSFTRYDIVNGGATFERPVVYPKEGEVCFIRSEQEEGITGYHIVLFSEGEKSKKFFKEGEIITAEAYFKMVKEYNEKL